MVQTASQSVLGKTVGDVNVQKQYTKTEINRMSTSELQELAFNNGVENAYEMTGSDLKGLLIEKFNL